jgi:hypothetical protein
MKLRYWTLLILGSPIILFGFTERLVLHLIEYGEFLAASLLLNFIKKD